MLNVFLRVPYFVVFNQIWWLLEGLRDHIVNNVLGEWILLLVRGGIISSIVLVSPSRTLRGRLPREAIVEKSVTAIIASKMTRKRIVATMETMMSLWQLWHSFWLGHDTEERFIWRGAIVNML